jgi:hypothetical protein
MKPTSEVDVAAMRKNISGHRYVTLRNQEVTALLDTIDSLERQLRALLTQEPALRASMGILLQENNALRDENERLLEWKASAIDQLMRYSSQVEAAAIELGLVSLGESLVDDALPRIIAKARGQGE